MTSVIRQLYDGDINLARQDPVFAEKRRLRKKLAGKHDDFIKELESVAPGLAERFETLMEEGIQALSMDSYEMFYNGFCLGSRLMLEILHSDFGETDH